ncbi:FAD-dependent oxidoreductase [Methanobrevibacter sp. OttesenSCG-928-I08]|nr:FAD-dependent oxidoreductase [Methanobrevibacter sp. OttesenSCG-928-I08]
MEKYDIIIIGAGPAGLTAGLYGGRQGNKVLLLEAKLAGGVGREVPAMENYPGFDIIAGVSLADKMKSQCEKNAQINELEKVNNIKKLENEEYNFEISTNNQSYLSKTIILATGSSHKHLNIKGEKEFVGRGVSYCATCDGMFFREKDVVMVGGGNSALQEAIYLSNIGCNVTIIHRRDKFRGEEFLQKRAKEKGIKTIMNSNVISINGETLVESVTIKDNKNNIKELKTNAIFISIGYDPHIELANKLNVNINENNYIITDKNQRTNVKYIYSAGDVTGGLNQWVVACSEGAIAATSAYEDIENQ